MDQPLSFAEIVQPILTEERRLELSPRDIALLATIKDESASSKRFSCWTPGLVRKLTL